MRTRLRLVALLMAPTTLLGASPSTSSIEFSLAGRFYEPVPVPAPGAGWLALSLAGSEFSLVATRLEANVVPESCAGSITQVIASGVKEPILLVRGSPRFRPGPVDTVFHGHRFLNPGEGLSFKLKWGDSFSLQAFGTVKPARGGPQYTDYHLVLSGRSRSQIVADFPALVSDVRPTLLWAGDLDRDDTLDALISLPIGEVSEEYVLLLSSQAIAGEHVRRAATFRPGAC
jgi:hypothetical protein